MWWAKCGDLGFGFSGAEVLVFQWGLLLLWFKCCGLLGFIIILENRYLPWEKYSLFLVLFNYWHRVLWVDLLIDWISGLWNVNIALQNILIDVNIEIALENKGIFQHN